MVLSLNLS